MFNWYYGSCDPILTKVRSYNGSDVSGNQQQGYDPCRNPYIGST